MPNSSKHTVLALEDPKQAALFFDYVIPFDLVALCTRKRPTPIHTGDLLSKLLPEELRSKSHPLGAPPVTEYFAQYLCARPDTLAALSREPSIPSPDSKLPTGETHEERLLNSIPKLIKSAKTLTSAAGSSYKGVFHRGGIGSDDEGEINPMLAVSGIELVDTTSLDWDHLIAFREDEKSVTQFRRFRHFVLQNYSGKPLSFIHDDILLRYEDYLTAIRSWDLRTVPGILSTTFSTKTIPAIVAGIGTFVGAGSLPAALAVGASLELGNIVLEIAKRRYKRAEVQAQAPLSYIAAIKSLAK